jgi:integrase
MPAAPTKRIYLSWKYNKIVLRLPIPKAAQPILGRPMFRLVMAQTQMLDAENASLPILTEWKRQIAEALQAGQDHQQAEIIRLRTRVEAHRKARGAAAPLTLELAELFEDIWTVIATQGGVNEIERRAIRAEALNSMDRTLLALPAPAQARQTLALVDGTAKPVTPFLAHLATWKERTHLKGKYLDQAVSSIEAFAKAVPCHLETLTGPMVQGWVERLLKPTDCSKPLLASSVQKMLKGPRSYWTWMADNGLADADRHPFNDRTVRDRRDVYEQKEAERQPFTPAEVVSLEAQAGNDRDLFAITKIGARTGMRREEIASLTVDQVRHHAGIRYLHEVGRKTRSAIRNVPIPSAIAGLIDELVANATPDGYLIHDGKIDKDGHRGATVGRRFSTMKTAMGFKKQVQCFHSLRHSAITAMEQQTIVTPPHLLKIVKNIVGHKDQDITSGRYAGTAELAIKLAVLETIRY